MTFRVSSADGGGELEVLNASGTVLATIVIPDSDQMQLWSDVQASTALSSGEQSLIVRAKSGSFSLNSIKFAGSVGVEENSGHAAAILWPTLVDNKLMIETDGSFQTLEIIDVLGRVHHSENHLNRKTSLQIDMSNAISGLHFVRLSGAKNKVLRFIKK
jgi:hypothetical protein